MTLKYNRLVKEKSPYLRQHATNPVDWYPWGEEAFRKARTEGKPVLLSIGYSACHWCHVMAHESFENDEIARIMNEHFVSIKVDREEYPDVDHLYQTFVQMISGRGGWPLTVFLTPDQVPFYGGTYFPATARYGMISFPELLYQITTFFLNQPDRISESTAEIQQLLERMGQSGKGEKLPDANSSFQQLFDSLNNSFDPVYGGFSRAPKFPHVSDMEFLLGYYHYGGDTSARQMVLHTLQKMAGGGIYDQIGGGFHRYATDEKWLVPHFEKMLYDNALLIPLYVDAYRLTGDESFHRVASETAEFVLRELRDPDGAFYATLDADSEGVEGKYYLWDYQDVWQALDASTREIFCEYYHLTPPGNFEGKNIPHTGKSLEALAAQYNLPVHQLREIIRKNRQKLREIRDRRIRPALDDKILADWNGLMVSALWKLGQVSGETEYVTAARNAVEYIQTHLRSPDGGIYHFVKNDREKISGYLDDYAFVIQALIDGFETVQDTAYLQSAVELTDHVLGKFRDGENGGFFFSSISAPRLLIRQKQVYDSSTPAGNSIMCRNLLRLSSYTGKHHYRDTAEEIFRHLEKEIETRGAGLTSLLSALLYFHYHPVEVTVSSPAPELPPDWLTAIHRLYLPNKVLVLASPAYRHQLIDPQLIQDRQLADKPAIYVCYQMTCSLPQVDPDQLPSVLSDLNLHIT